ncbi:ZIP family metal transporter [Patiriisocius sp. Uisw_017]|jgi:zinc transporter ZupT|uniref:ZIP family metal transporter n=1 Tax=Patiriisocius sp. Uisw_017 TaxID=3230968 RepID=UPI0039E7A349
MTYIILILTVFAGLFVAYALNGKEFKYLSLLLAFSGAFLLAITLFELLPEVYTIPSKEIGVYIVLGILLQICLEFFSKGAEHGHVHIHSETKRFPLLLFLSLSLHAGLEGFPIADNHSMFIGVLIHKLPIAMILSLFFIKAGYKRSTTIIFLVLFALMTPIGAFIASNSLIAPDVLTKINALVIGIFLHVSTTILFESSRDHKFNLAKLLTIILGFLLAYIL